jgi:hypothetical protein
MPNAAQTKADRLRRLSECRCPVHGTAMVQVDRSESQFLVACPRSDCRIRGTTITALGEVELLPEFAYLLS